MRGWLGALGGLAAVAGFSATAQAAEPTAQAQRRADPWGVDTGTPYVRFEADGLAAPGTWATPAVGGEVAIIAGRPHVHARIGVGAAATSVFTVGDRGTVGTVVEASDIRLCSAAHRGIHRIRLCGGVQAGVMHLRWYGYAQPGRRDLPWAQAVVGGDYAFAIGRVVDLHAGVGVGLPFIRQQLVVQSGDATSVRRSGSYSSTFRLGLGFRLG